MRKVVSFLVSEVKTVFQEAVRRAKAEGRLASCNQEGIESVVQRLSIPASPLLSQDQNRSNIAVVDYVHYHRVEKKKKGVVVEVIEYNTLYRLRSVEMGGRGRCVFSVENESGVESHTITVAQ